MSKGWALLTAMLVACRSSDAAQEPGTAPRSPQPAAREDMVRAETVARDLNHPWGLAILPDGRFLVTERSGGVRLISKDGRTNQQLSGAPPVKTGGQGGMLDVALDPGFAQNRTIYLSYSEPDEDDRGSGTSVARARLDDSALVLRDLRVIYRQVPKVRSGAHFGSRLVFRRDGTLFVTQGDRFNYRDRAQDLTSGIGKIVRINTDGSIPRDNPFVGRSDARPEIWSYGHRNAQAAAIHPETGQLWTGEHGAAGGDEINHPEPGKNYGWPEITYGRDYNGRRIGTFVKPGMEQPVYYWDPVISPSGMEFYTGDRYRGWKGSMFVGSLTFGALVRLTFDKGVVTSEERHLHDMRERIRDVTQGPDGYLYLITDSNDGRILRVVPK
jgi:glucose/arabinose dehydrogenase